MRARNLAAAERLQRSPAETDNATAEPLLDDLERLLSPDLEGREESAVRVRAWAAKYCLSAHFSWRRLDRDAIDDIVGDALASFFESAADPRFQNRLALRELKTCIERHRKRAYRDCVARKEVAYPVEAVSDISESAEWWGRVGTSREDIQAAVKRIYAVLPEAIQRLNDRYYNIVVEVFGLEQVGLCRRPGGRAMAVTAEAKGKARNRALVQVSHQLERVLEEKRAGSPEDEILALAVRIVQADISKALTHGLECLCA